MLGRRGVPADDRVDLLVAVNLLAFVLVEGPAQQFDILLVFGEADAVLFAAFDDPAVLEVDAALNRRGGLDSRYGCHAQQRQQHGANDPRIHGVGDLGF